MHARTVNSLFAERSRDGRSEGLQLFEFGTCYWRSNQSSRIAKRNLAV